MDFGSDGHIRHTIPEVECLSILPETSLPLVGAGAKRERREGVGENVSTGMERKVLGRTGPHQLSLSIEESDAVFAVGDRLSQLNDKIDGDGAEGGKYMLLTGWRRSHLPS